MYVCVCAYVESMWCEVNTEWGREISYTYRKLRIGGRGDRQREIEAKRQRYCRQFGLIKLN